MSMRECAFARSVGTVSPRPGSAGRPRAVRPEALMRGVSWPWNGVCARLAHHKIGPGRVGLATSACSTPGRVTKLKNERNASALFESLGPVDGFHQDQAVSECDDGAETLCGLFAALGDELEAFQLANCLLDPGTCLVERLGKEARPVFGVRAMRNDRSNAALAAGCATGD
jgi:hypothetical protein